MYKAFLVKYSEIGIKGKNRYIFENALRDQIKNALDLVEGEFSVTKEQGRIYIEALTEYDYDETVEALTRVFGIAGIMPVMLIEDSTWDNLTKEVEEYVRKLYGDKEFTFKVEAKRGNKQYPMNSPEICMELGGYLLEKFPNIKVDVHNPEVRINIEIRNKAYVYSTVISGAGGMPVGTNGKAMLLLSGGIDSPVAGYMIAKRGVKLDATYFHAPPYTSERAKEKVVDLARLVSKYSGPIDLHIVNFTDIQLYIYEKCPHDELTIIMRRYMMKIAEKLAVHQKCSALITGESVGQVASQTIYALGCTDQATALPVFRPCIGMDKDEIIKISREIDTFETSILPYEDCCTVFTPKHPKTRPQIEDILKAEEALDSEALIERAVNSARKTVIH